MTLNRRSVFKTLGAGAAANLILPGSWARADSFPTRPVRVITPFPPGAGPDAALRVLSDPLTRKWNQPLLVDNRPGGNGFIAVAALKQGGTDGYDLIELDNSHITTHPRIFSNLPYDVGRDFAPIRMILRTSFFVTVAADGPYKSLEDIVNAARAAPGKLSYGSWFIGSPGHLGALRLQAMTGTQMVHVPYRDFGQLYTAVANKELDWALGSTASAGSMERSGRIRFIAFAASQRDKLYPQVPCTAELPGFHGFEVAGWAGVFAPRSTPAPTRTRLADDLGEALRAPAVADRYASLGFEAPDLATDAFAALINKETEAWAGTIRSASIRID